MKEAIKMLLDGFIQGLKKSFSFTHDSRKLNLCPDCGENAFFTKCLYCKTYDDYNRKQ